jgi:hypothetical protein
LRGLEQLPRTGPPEVRVFDGGTSGVELVRSAGHGGAPRSWPSHTSGESMNSDPQLRNLTDSELGFARRIEEVLQAAKVIYERLDIEVSPPLESHVQFELDTSANLSLRVTLTVHGDLFVINANEADARIQSTGYTSGMEAAWLEDSSDMLEYLITHDLRIRTRRRLLGRRAGAIYFQSISGKGVWAGDLFARWWGKERKYSNWLQKRVD